MNYTIEPTKSGNETTLAYIQTESWKAINVPFVVGEYQLFSFRNIFEKGDKNG